MVSIKHYTGPMKATLTVEEMGKIMRIGRSSAYAAVHSGEIETIVIRGRILVPTATLERRLGLPAGTLSNADGSGGSAP